ncbi:DUF4259 domain-containing protein [Microbispora sp. NPDC049125]|uniref:DUF4259 domain-containing protein n=1 Tax=Microbispora sp. NPDC049125 TaxID=3154929 RepID=UPI0034677EB5
MDDRTPFLEGPFDSDEAADAVAELEDGEDVAAGMAEMLDDFVRENTDHVHEGDVEAALAVACLVAARISGIAPDEAAHHWLDRNPFTPTDGLRGRAAAAFRLATRGEDNDLGEIRAGDWEEFLDHLEPYRKALHGEPQEPPAPFVPDLSHREPWLRAFWSVAGRDLPHDVPYARAAERLVSAVNGASDWLGRWRPAGLRELTVFGRLVPGARAERISRGRTTAEAWIDFGHPPEAAGDTAGGSVHASAARQAREDLHGALAAAGRRLGLGPVPPLPVPAD